MEVTRRAGQSTYWRWWILSNAMQQPNVPGQLGWLKGSVSAWHKGCSSANTAWISIGTKQEWTMFPYLSGQCPKKDRWGWRLLVWKTRDRSQLFLVEAWVATSSHVQLFYKGKTTKSFPTVDFPKQWHLTFTANHWSNESTMIDYVKFSILIIDHWSQLAGMRYFWSTLCQIPQVSSFSIDCACYYSSIS